VAELVDAPDLKSSLDLNNRWTGLAETLVPFFIVLVYESAQKYLLNMLTEKQIEDQQEFER